MTQESLLVWLVAFAAGCAWMMSGVNPIRLTIDLLEFLERALRTAWDCAQDLPETYADRWNKPKKDPAEAAQEERA